MKELPGRELVAQQPYPSIVCSSKMCGFSLYPQQPGKMTEIRGFEMHRWRGELRTGEEIIRGQQ